MSDCLFCKIASGEIESEITYSDDQVVAFEDVNPQAPIHILIIPKKHISTMNDLEESDKKLMGHLFSIGSKIAKEKGIAEKGYRSVLNTNREAGQSVFHIHLHLMGGRPMGWPPG
jgi:histidine triad (HIT) family protein